MRAGSAGGVPGGVPGRPPPPQRAAGHVAAAGGGRLLRGHVRPDPAGPPPGLAARQRARGQDAGLRCHPGMLGTRGEWARCVYLFDLFI